MTDLLPRMADDWSGVLLMIVLLIFGVRDVLKRPPLNRKLREDPQYADTWQRKFGILKLAAGGFYLLSLLIPAQKRLLLVIGFVLLLVCVVMAILFHIWDHSADT